MEIKTNVDPEKKFKNFNDTFKLCAFSLACAGLYPNRSNVFKRTVMVTMVVLSSVPQLFWFITYTSKCLYILDIYNFSRNMTLAVIVLLFFIKTYYVISATYKFASLLDTISKDLVRANNLDEDYQEMYVKHIKEGKFAEIIWLICPIVLSAQFPIYAGILMSIESIQTDDYEKRMVHDMDVLFFEDIQSETPFFQIMYAYNCTHCIFLVPNYCGFDGSFCIATIHLRLKLKLMTHKVRRAFEDAKNRFDLREKLNDAIKDHQSALDFYVLLQNVYGTWLFAVFMLTSSMISFNLYQIYLLKRIEPKYTMFGLFGVLHIYLPSDYASTLTKIGEEIPDELYSVPWESCGDPKVTKLLVYMIARAQKKLIVTGNGLVVFNMELFKSILQTSYSFMTLITSNND